MESNDNFVEDGNAGEQLNIVWGEYSMWGLRSLKSRF